MSNDQKHTQKKITRGISWRKSFRECSSSASQGWDSPIYLVTCSSRPKFQSHDRIVQRVMQGSWLWVGSLWPTQHKILCNIGQPNTIQEGMHRNVQRSEQNVCTYLKYILSALVIVLISHSAQISSSVSAVFGSMKGEIPVSHKIYLRYPYINPIFRLYHATPSNISLGFTKVSSVSLGGCR